MSEFLRSALEYHARGWSIIPIRGGKRPAVPWKQYQSERPDKATLERWFRRDDLHGLGVIAGAVSGGLVVRDYDQLAAYERWAADFPELAGTLPTVQTGRGYHMYFKADVGRIIKQGDGELRGAGFIVLPPSLHPTGAVYRWLIALPDGELPELDPFQNGLADRETETTERTEKTEKTEKQSNCSVLSVLSVSPADFPGMEEAIASTLPTAPGMRHRAVFELARTLKAIPALADVDVRQLRDIVREWHRRALPVIGTKPFDDTWADFVYAWPRVKFPKGQEMTQIAEKADASPLPKVAEHYDTPQTRRLIAICRELQREAGNTPFFLSCRMAGALLDMDHATAWRRLKMFEADGALKTITPGTKTKATRFRYVGGD